jgi:GNAT superfamily N-acetyltransferase
VGIKVSASDVYEVIASGLIAQLDAEIERRYPGEPINGIDPVEFRASGGYFVIGYWDSQAAGCGAFRPYDQTTVEIKRMFVKPEFQRRGIARAILGAVETEARKRGYKRSILETANRQPEAVALYRSCGYLEIAKNGHYIDSARSLCFEKTLS